MNETMLVQPGEPSDELVGLSDLDLLRLRARVAAELKKRGLALNVGQVAESLAIATYNATPGRANLQPAPTGTQNVDALSRRGDRYSIKGVLDARKTGTVYPDREDPDKQLFEYLIVVRIDADWQLVALYEFDWKTFCEVRSWDRRMNAWYVGLAAKTLARATQIMPRV
ncbi:hypothetical protein ASE04_18400 [Rhizobium sp. Root708]|uniref:hypothetical protein n=1 Tax=Rhizobium sp. Root708 TaxID=1736592 RepID=UPI0007023947|nr:hypothetical protein [Rhizobium sp. Root708]KRB49153.1 hypothetical protein ASE04_18400 [Rhizobium sp. Root708]